MNQRLLDASRFFGLCALFFLPISIGLVNTFAALFALSVFINRDFWRDLGELWKIETVKIALILLVVILLAAFYSSAPLSAAFDFASKYRKLLFIPLLIWAFRDAAWHGRTRWTLLAGLSIMLLLSYTNYMGWTDLFRPKGVFMATDAAIVFHHRITQGVFTTLLFCLALWMFQRESDKRLKIAFLLIALLAAADVMWLINSRTGQLCLIAVSLWMLTMAGLDLHRTSRTKATALFVSGLLIIGASLIVTVEQKDSRLASVRTEMQEVGGSAETSTGQRLEFYRLSWKMIQAHPVFGTGTGSSAVESARMVIAHETTLSGAMNHPHNEYLLMAIQMGLLGFVLFVWLLVAIYKAAQRLPRIDRLCLQSYLLIFAVGCLVNSFLLDFNEGNMFVFLAGIFLAPLYSKTTQLDGVRSA